MREHNVAGTENRAHCVGDAVRCNRNGMMTDATKLEQVIANCPITKEKNYGETIK